MTRPSRTQQKRNVSAPKNYPESRGGLMTANGPKRGKLEGRDFLGIKDESNFLCLIGEGCQGGTSSPLTRNISALINPKGEEKRGAAKSFLSVVT